MQIHYLYAFRCFINNSSAADVVFQIAQLIVGKAKDAPAKIAVIAVLCLVVFRSATANVIATGLLLYH